MTKILSRLLPTIICSFIISACSNNKECVEVSRFCEDLIGAYCDSYRNVFKEEPSELYMVAATDKEYQYLDLWGDNREKGDIYPFCLKNYLGRVVVNHRPVLVCGPGSTIFYHGKMHRASPINGRVVEYDPLMWHIVIRKRDTTYCLMKSRSNYPAVNVNIVDSIALSYFSPSIMTGSEVYENSELDVCARPASFSYEESLILLKTKYRFTDRLPKNKEIWIDLLIDKEGHASIFHIDQKSRIKCFDNEAMRMASDICNYQFRPAQIRGQNVNTLYHLWFVDEGLRYLW